MVNEGDGLFHLATVRAKDDAAATLSDLETQLEEADLFDEDEII